MKNVARKIKVNHHTAENKPPRITALSPKAKYLLQEGRRTAKRISPVPAKIKKLVQEFHESGLSPQAKTRLERIDRIRQAIGPVPFETGELIREMNEADE